MVSSSYACCSWQQFFQLNRSSISARASVLTGAADCWSISGETGLCRADWNWPIIAVGGDICVMCAMCVGCWG